jgi:two-component system sensor histidine kinase KdpD
LVDAPVIESIGESIGNEEEPAGHAITAEERHRLSRLREMALLVAAEVVDRQLESYLRLHGIDQIWGVQERILVCVTPRSNAARMLESGRRNADRFHGELYAVYVKQPALSEPDRAVLRQNLDYARELEAHVETLSGLNAAEAIMKFAREKGITQMFVGHSMRQGAWRRLWSNLIDRLIRSAEGIDVVVYPH